MRILRRRRSATQAIGHQLCEVVREAVAQVFVFQAELDGGL
jgi:hypothetical protein